MSERSRTVDRLTESKWMKDCKFGCKGKCVSGATSCFTLGQAIKRLAAYEDTGLEPSEISEREEMFVAYRHICGGKSPEEAQSNFEELSAYRTAEEQRNKGCDFCNGHEHYHFYAGYSQQLDVVDKFVEREIEEINFCPICGRALKGGE